MSCADILAVAARDSVVAVSLYIYIYDFKCKPNILSRSSSTLRDSYIHICQINRSKDNSLIYKFYSVSWVVLHGLCNLAGGMQKLQASAPLTVTFQARHPVLVLLLRLSLRKALAPPIWLRSQVLYSYIYSKCTINFFFYIEFNIYCSELTKNNGTGAHTIGQARCTTFRTRIYNETNINSAFKTSLQGKCPSSGGDNNLSPLDMSTPTSFDNSYYKNLINLKGLLHSDQQLFNNGSTDSQVNTYSSNGAKFNSDFTSAMVKMGNISPLTGSNGEIRTNCRKIN